MSTRALGFGAVAEAYERFRPGYPEELLDTIVEYADRPIRRALEIGAGTGKATRLFAGHGVEVTATDPDEAMLTELRRHVPAEVTTVASAFEDLPAGGGHDLVYAAASLHWTRSDGRWSRVAALLAPGGVFAAFGGPAHLADPALADAVRAAREPFLASDDMPVPDDTPGSDAMRWPGTELRRTALFTDVRQSVIERRHKVTADDYVGLLSTVSAYLELAPLVRAEVYERIRGVLPETVEVVADIPVHLARLRPT